MSAENLRAVNNTPKTQAREVSGTSGLAREGGGRQWYALLDRALAQGRSFRVPAGVVGQAWRDGQTQAALARFLRTKEVEIVSFDEHLARSCGELCRARGTSDIIDASVVLLARERHDIIVTSDIDDLRRLDPKSQIVEI